jgi:molecular chaperone HtpG
MDVEKSEPERDEEGKVVEGGETKTWTEEETLNSMKALWTRSKSDIEDKEYTEFYRHLTHDWNSPSDHIHLKVEGMQEYTALMYVPEKAPHDLFTRESRRGLQLYVKNVFIMDECRELMPEYLRFVRGLVDSPDLSLNVSREMVQQDRVIGSMRKHLTKKMLGQFKDNLAKDREGYEKFWMEFGPALKEGFHYEPGNKEKLEEITLFHSTNGDSWTTLAEYKERMLDGQKAIYFLIGDSLDRLKGSPQLEVFADKGVEVLLLNDPVDEIAFASLNSYKEVPFKSVAHGDLELEGLDADKEEKSEEEKAAENANLEPLLTGLQKCLDAYVEKVLVSTRLTDSAACLVSPENGLSPQMERMMRSMGQDVPAQKRHLEINPKHALITKMIHLCDGESEGDKLAEFGEMLFDQALLSEGGQIRNPALFAKRVAEVMAASLPNG